MTLTSTVPTTRSRSCTIKSSIPQSPSSSMNAATNNGSSSSSSNNNVMFRSQHLQFGLILIVISVLLIDGIAIVSHSNLFESISTTVGATTTTRTNRHLRQIEVTNIRTTSRETDVPPTSSEESDFRVPSASSNDVNEPKIVWLMSFPNSGTSYTSQLVRDTTYTISASNYADETPLGLEGFLEPVYEDQIQGPFWIRPEETPIEYTEPSQYILTKVSERYQTEGEPSKHSSFSNTFSHTSLYVPHVNDDRHIVVCVVRYVHPKSTVNLRTASVVDVRPRNGSKKRRMGRSSVCLGNTRSIESPRRYISSVTHSIILYHDSI